MSFSEFKATVRDPSKRNLNLVEVCGCRHASDWSHDGVAHVYDISINQPEIKSKLVKLEMEWQPRDLVEKADAQEFNDFFQNTV